MNKKQRQTEKPLPAHLVHTTPKTPAKFVENVNIPMKKDIVHITRQKSVWSRVELKRNRELIPIKKNEVKAKIMVPIQSPCSVLGSRRRRGQISTDTARRRRLRPRMNTYGSPRSDGGAA